LNKRVAIIGIDGGTFDIILPLINKGLLPNIGSFLSDGSWGTLASTIPPITMPAWPTLITGVNPARHGIFYFKCNTHETYDEGPLVNSSYLKVKSVWEMLSEYEKKLIAVAVPTTYPPIPVNGVMISSIRPAHQEQIKTYPPEIGEEITRVFGLERIKVEKLNIKRLRRNMRYSERSQVFSRFLTFHLAGIEKLADMVTYLMDKTDWSFLFVVFQSSDVAQHFCWALMDKEHPNHDRKLAERFGEIIYEIYKKIDGAIGRIIEKAGKDTTFIIVSDHGAGPVHKGLYLNNWLLKEGFLTLKNQRRYRIRIKKTRLENILRRLRMDVISERLPRSLASLSLPVIKKQMLPPHEIIDWSKTIAYATRNGININLKGREPEGIVDLNEYDKVVDTIKARLEEFVDPETGKNVVERVYKKEEIYNGPYINDANDLYIATGDSLYLPLKIIDNGDIIRRLSPNAVSGHHINKREGIFLIKGPHCKRNNRLNGLSIVDVLPTAIYLLGLDIPEYLEGRVITEAIKEDTLKNNPPRYVRMDPSSKIEKGRLSKEEMAELEAELKNLGYI
jgi:predicted AlkP superfamily phosphohydrolase/phosphomutase